jgi:hypothetical protein
MCRVQKGLRVQRVLKENRVQKAPKGLRVRSVYLAA